MTTVTPWEEDLDSPSRLSRWAALVRKQPSAILLTVQIVVILLLPWLESVTYGRLTLSLISLFALIVAVVTVRSTPALTWLSIVLMVPASALEIWGALAHDSSWVVSAAHSALAAFYAYTAYALIRYMFEDAWVTKDELFAVGACFTVLLFAFAYAFLAIQEIWHGSFVSHDGGGQRGFLELVYFSGANLTSVGLSDVVPVRPHARALTTVEQLTGVLYVAMVISRLVALTVIRARS